MNNNKSFTSGGVLSALIKFAVLVFAAMLLQSLYGAVDLLVVGQFAETIDVSGVATGSLLIEQAFQYLRAYAIDTFFTAVLFCYIGYYNGCGKTLFVMIQGIVGAFCVSVPMVFLMSNLSNATFSISV